MAALAPATAFAQPALPDTIATLEPPHLISNGLVPYPEGGRGKATVLLTMTVNANGSVRSAVPFETNEPFSSAATHAALAWRYDPAIRNGKPVASRIRVEIVFEPRAPVPSTA
ncbi:MAG: energy transducer TonB, partial [Myxococcota bacterium]|nr:energy transducer TonB [Myxococcota bacterium]